MRVHVVGIKRKIRKCNQNGAESIKSNKNVSNAHKKKRCATQCDTAKEKKNGKINSMSSELQGDSPMWCGTACWLMRLISSLLEHTSRCHHFARVRIAISLVVFVEWKSIERFRKSVTCKHEWRWIHSFEGKKKKTIENILLLRPVNTAHTILDRSFSWHIQVDTLKHRMKWNIESCVIISKYQPIVYE